jgi:hypothetical protein
VAVVAARRREAVRRNLENMVMKNKVNDDSEIPLNETTGERLTVSTIRQLK